MDIQRTQKLKGLDLGAIAFQTPCLDHDDCAMWYRNSQDLFYYSRIADCYD